MLLLAMAIAPVAAIIWFVIHLDRLNKEPWKMLVRTFLFGVLSVLPAIILEHYGMNWLGNVDSVGKAAIEAFIVVGFSEELAKYFFLRTYVYKSKHFDEPFDGIVYAVMISLGFAAIENVMYVMQGGMTTAIARMFTAVPAHATFAILMGFWMGKAKMENKAWLNWVGLLSATAFHGAYDFFLLQNLFQGQIAGALASLFIGLVLARIAIKIHLRYKKTHLNQD
ncbi:MAG: PrsW family intramembrane metalloprotease [Bacteroidia bacterium]